MRGRWPLILLAGLALCAGPAVPRAPVPAPHTGPGLLEQVPLAGIEAGLRGGDLVFRRGDGRFSGYIAGISGDGGYFSHVGIAVQGPAGWQVVHTEADERTGVGGVRSDALADFLADARGVAVVRPRLGPASAQAVVDATGHARWREVPFDADFRLDDAGRAMYCTEWVQALVLAATGQDIARPRTRFIGREAITVDDLLLSAQVQPVLDHRLPD